MKKYVITLIMICCMVVTTHIEATEMAQQSGIPSKRYLEKHERPI